jgi:hypothetical protein
MGERVGTALGDAINPGEAVDDSDADAVGGGGVPFEIHPAAARAETVTAIHNRGA